MALYYGSLIWDLLITLLEELDVPHCLPSWQLASYVLCAWIHRTLDFPFVGPSFSFANNHFIFDSKNNGNDTSTSNSMCGWQYIHVFCMLSPFSWRHLTQWASLTEVFRWWNTVCELPIYEKHLSNQPTEVCYPTNARNLDFNFHITEKSFDKEAAWLDWVQRQYIVIEPQCLNNRTSNAQLGIWVGPRLTHLTELLS